MTAEQFRVRNSAMRLIIGSVTRDQAMVNEAVAELVGWEDCLALIDALTGATAAIARDAGVSDDDIVEWARVGLLYIEEQA